MVFDYSPILLSIKVSLISILVVVCFAIPIAGVMAKRNFPGKDIVESVLTLPLVLPPSVIGFTLLLLFGKNGPIGKPPVPWVPANFESSGPLLCH